MTWFVDTAVVMYAAGRPHPLREPCQRLLRKVATTPPAYEYNLPQP